MINNSESQNYKKKLFFFFNGVPLRGFVASQVIFRFCARKQKKHCGNIK